MLINLIQCAIEGFAIVFDDPAAQFQIFLHRHGRENTVSLNEMGNPQAQHLIGFESLDRLSIMKNITPAGAEIPINGFKQGRLARSVGPDDAREGPFLRNNTHIRQNRDLFYVTRSNIFSLKRHNQCPR